jgi:hypothetical protein
MTDSLTVEIPSSPPASVGEPSPTPTVTPPPPPPNKQEEGESKQQTGTAESKKKKEKKRKHEEKDKPKRKRTKIETTQPKKRVHHPAVWGVEINKQVCAASHHECAETPRFGVIELKVNYNGPVIDLLSKKRVEASVFSSVRSRPIELMVHQYQETPGHWCMSNKSGLVQLFFKHENPSGSLVKPVAIQVPVNLLHPDDPVLHKAKAVDTPKEN